MHFHSKQMPMKIIHPICRKVRAFNQQLAQLAHMPQGASILTKEGLSAARNSMAPDNSMKTQLQPSVKYIPGPAGNLALRIFKT